MKKLRKTFMKRGYGYSLCKSDCSPILLRPSPQEIVLGRLRGRIRRLFDVGAVIRVETRETRGTEDSILLGGHRWENFSHHKIARYSIPQRGILPLHNKQMDAISPRRRRIPSGAARERSSHVLDSTKLVSNRTCTNSTHQIPLIKVLRSFFKSDRLPRSPRSPVPRTPQEAGHEP